MKISSEILKDSQFNGERITTFLINIPKFILYDACRHRNLSWSAGSSRAIGTNKLIDLMTYVPTFWGKNCPGMQNHEELSAEDIENCKIIWQDIKLSLCEKAKGLLDLGLGKQCLNRILEHMAYVKVVVTGTSWESFFSLRAEYMAEPHLGYLATLMLDQYLTNIPEEKAEGDWHIPFIKPEEEKLSIKEKLVKSMARCARTSYNNFYGKDDFTLDLKLHDMLIKDKHYSPGEHQAQAVLNGEKNSNFSKSWNQYRKTFEVDERIDLQQRLKEMKKLCLQRGFEFD